MSAATNFSKLLSLKREPVAIGFLPAPPEGMSRIDESKASGCTYWKLAAQGESFYTEAADHYGCPIGAHTGAEIDAVAKQLATIINANEELEAYHQGRAATLKKRASL